MKKIRILVTVLVFLVFIFAPVFAQNTDDEILNADPELVTRNFNAQITQRLGMFSKPYYVDNIKDRWANGTLGFSIKFIDQAEYEKNKLSEGVTISPFFINRQLVIGILHDNADDVASLIDSGHLEHERMNRGLDAILIALEMIYERKNNEQRQEIMNSLEELSRIQDDEQRERKILEIFKTNMTTMEALMFAGEFIKRYSSVHSLSEMNSDISAILGNENRSRLDKILLDGFIRGIDFWKNESGTEEDNKEYYNDYDDYLE
ncbi:MAG: hypothetical protein COV29_00450 [Candidatus Yanofskybacteria bacterium CG10_big_fil_rev_8_21_14_0_10_36_16]|uniref:DUF5667 domain-containing protein n=1 Tax=Candidatus Yanofskybacteria bacterium CG10_big_fil_rev_8_21_14_0_10_36_16 TaxID=1975096 RepID=A0A2J0Q8A4_9BACT|nr:MAG: hypothetical protein COV29_00450 [Candidatus Yanofskybacteria bacterium CG10_big_fil_rev_8_21_14_0_10_36_16]